MPSTATVETATVEQPAGGGTSSSGTSSGSDVSNVDRNADEVKAQSDDERDGSSSATPSLNDQKSEFQMAMERRREELEDQKRRLTAKQSQLFLQQVDSMKRREYKGLFDVFSEFATGHSQKTLDIDGLADALTVFGMVIDSPSDPAFRRHIYKKFDIDNEGHITYDDFSATLATFVGNNTDEKSLQDLFEIFDLDQDGCLSVDEIARLLLAQNHIMLVSTGSDLSAPSAAEPWSEGQCLKYAKRLIRSIDSKSAGFRDLKISFDNFLRMMSSRSNQLMLQQIRPPTADSEIKFDPDDIAQTESM